MRRIVRRFNTLGNKILICKEMVVRSVRSLKPQDLRLIRVISVVLLVALFLLTVKDYLLRCGNLLNQMTIK